MSNKRLLVSALAYALAASAKHAPKVIDERSGFPKPTKGDTVKPIRKFTDARKAAKRKKR